MLFVSRASSCGSGSSSDEAPRSLWEQIVKPEIDCNKVVQLFTKKATKEITLVQSFAKPKPKKAGD